MVRSHLTQKSAEALDDAQTKALRFGTPRSTASTCCWRVDQAEGIAPGC